MTPRRVQDHGDAKLAAVRAGKVTLLDYHSAKQELVTALVREVLLWRQLGTNEA